MLEKAMMYGNGWIKGKMKDNLHLSWLYFSSLLFVEVSSLKCGSFLAVLAKTDTAVSAKRNSTKE
jgi:hypothetical protein